LESALDQVPEMAEKKKRWVSWLLLLEAILDHLLFCYLKYRHAHEFGHALVERNQSERAW
jgi:hypothetical protein